MRLLSVPPRQGALWVRRGISVFVRAPLPFLSLFGVLLLAGVVEFLLPVVGAMLLFASPPLISLGFMIATREVLEGNPRPSARVFVDPLRANKARTRAMLILCGSYALLLALSIVVSNVVSGGQLIPVLSGAAGRGEQLGAELAQPGMLAAVMLCATLLSVLSLAYWHAPALVYWDGQGAGQAVFSSTLACWRSKGAFTIYWLVWFGLNNLANWIVVGVTTLLGIGHVGVLLVVPLNLLMCITLYTSLYFTFADCFIDTAGDPSPVTSA
jgi:hypothetical protein